MFESKNWLYGTWFGLVLWHIKHRWLFKAKSCFYMYIRYMFHKRFEDKQLTDQTVLFLIILFSINQQNKRLQVLLCITNNSFTLYSFVYNGQTVLFQTIHFSKQTKLNGSKYCYVSLTIPFSISYLFAHS